MVKHGQKSVLSIPSKKPHDRQTIALMPTNRPNDKTPQYQQRPEENSKKTNRIVCWTPIEISDRCRMSSPNSHLRPNVLQVPKLSSISQECHEEIDFNPKARLFSRESKGISFQHVIIERSLRVTLCL